MNASSRLLTHSNVDLAIIALYFAALLSISFYLEAIHLDWRRLFPGRPRDARLGGRLKFPGCQSRRARNDGLGAAAYQYGILATHWYWIGAIRAMLFSRPGHEAVQLAVGFSILFVSILHPEAND